MSNFDIADEPRAFTVDQVLGVTADREPDDETTPEYIEVSTMDGNVTMLAVDNGDEPMRTDKAEVARRLQMAHAEVEYLVAEKLNLFDRLRESRERLSLIARAARVYGIEAPASTPDD